MSAFTLQIVEVSRNFADSPIEWFTEQAQAHDLRHLLAHADDGVVWGRFDDNGLHTSHGIAKQSPMLRGVTLQQCRLFGPAGELLVWRDETGWRARLVNDVAGISEDRFDEDQILWGTLIERVENGFTLVRDGDQGMRHAVPVKLTNEQLKQRQLRLRVRHYITYNDDGEARIGLSRLVQLLPETT